MVSPSVSLSVLIKMINSFPMLLLISIYSVDFSKSIRTDFAPRE